MFSWLTRPSRHTALINQQAVTVEPGETLLKAALRQGVDYPHHCRAGGCGVCKCRLLGGKVKQLTDSSYVLSADELAGGYVLACQSLLQSDVVVAVERCGPAVRQCASGRVVGQGRLTRDITRLSVQLDQAIEYKGGQFANLGIERLPGVARSYSFATAPQVSRRVEFFVRKVPGGLFSSLVNEQDVTGRVVTVEGPAGDFWLRPSDAPLLLVAGGSGLAPILALLEDAVRQGCARPVTLLFGARTEADLYAVEEIGAVARRWPASFRFIPVLSEATPGDGWGGERGLVTEHLAASLEAGADCYLCGPPGLVDTAVSLLGARGVEEKRIFTDRFFTRPAVVSPFARPRE